VARIADVPGYAAEGQATWHALRAELGIEAFGVGAYTATAAGQHVVPEHDETGESSGHHEELYVVLSGHATFTVDGEQHDAPAGTAVFVPDPASKRAATAADAGTVVLAVGGRRGEAFTVSPWEIGAQALRYWPTKEWDKAIAVLERAVEALPGNAGPHYNLACAFAQAGRADEALDQLARAVEIEPRFRAAAQTDDDLAPIRADPRFPEAAA
jgi:quercetin dioxygenase-like cupin family protein